MASASLPLYKRYINGVPMPTTSRKTFRLREKYIFVILLLFGLVCYIGVFFLPDLRGSKSINKAYHGLKKAGEDVFLPRPQSAYQLSGKPEFNVIAHGNKDLFDPHRADDKAKLLQKVEENLKNQLGHNVREQVEKPNMKVNQDRVKKPSSQNNIETNQEKKVIDVQDPEKLHYLSIFGLNDGVPPDDDSKMKQNFVREMMKHAWKGYVRYAWGKNELRPISKRGHSPSIFGKGALGATIVDGLDTLYLMKLNDEYKEGRAWIATELSVDKMESEISVFETNIRYIGGLLSCYALTKDEIFKVKAEEFANKLLPAFNSQTNIPYALVNPKSGFARNFAWASSSSSILSEFGTLHLEFMYLSNVTGNPIFHDKVMKIRKVLQNIDKVSGGLYPNYLHPKTGKWGLNHISIGALGDSFYEYLFKAWLQSNKEDHEALEMFISAMTAIEKHMLHHTKNGLTYFSEMRSQRQEHKMGHLACFIGGLYALAAVNIPEKYNLKSRYMSIAENITHTCHESYDRTATKIGPETFWFSDGNEAKAVKANDRYYIQRPEVIESYYVLWRVTKNPKYRQWGWEAAQAIERHCKVEGGYTGLKNVYAIDSPKDDVQQSFFLAETLKYLYLLFSPDDLLPIDKWVLNTEAHPLPIQQFLPLVHEL